MMRMAPHFCDLPPPNPYLQSVQKKIISHTPIDECSTKHPNILEAVKVIKNKEDLEKL